MTHWLLRSSLCRGRERGFAIQWKTKSTRLDLSEQLVYVSMASDVRDRIRGLQGIARNLVIDSELNGQPKLKFKSSLPMLAASELILHPVRAWSRDEVLATPSPVPRMPGIYGWYFRDIPYDMPVEEYVRFDGQKLLYIGISPSAPPRNGKLPSQQNLSCRIRYHYQGNAEGSTLRLTLGCLLSKALGIQLRRVGSGKRLPFAEGDPKLSQWMANNAYVVWAACEEPWLTEDQLISTVFLPLNLDQNRANCFHPVLSTLRRQAKMRAREMPIWRSTQ
jgi:hypothetical protein